MKLDTLKLLLASLAVSSFAVVGCAADATPSEDDAAEDVEVSEAEISSRSKQFVGDFSWSAALSGNFVDFEHLSLHADGTYDASVDALLVDPKVRCITFPCTLGESGTWTTVKSQGKLKIKVDPTGAKPARSYFAAISGKELSLKRFGTTTKLFKNVAPPVSCAAMLCAPGTTCIDTPTGGECVPVATCAATLCAVGTICVDKPTGAECIPATPPKGACVKTGCSGQICADSPRFSTCEFREEYACYATAACERQADGKCGWTQTPALQACLDSH